MKNLKNKFMILGALLAIGAVQNAQAAGAAAGDTISNIGTFQYEDDAGQVRTEQTTPVNLTVQQVYNVSITPDGTRTNPGQTVYATPGQTGTLTYTVSNTGNGTDTIKLSVDNGQGGTVSGAKFYLDSPTGTPGVFDPTDTEITELSNLTADQIVTIFVQLPIDANVPANQQTFVNLIGQSAGNATVTDNNNVGLITAQNVISLSLTTNNTLNATTPGSVVAVHTLQNTGNSPLDMNTLVATTTLSDPNAVLSGATYQIQSATYTGPVSNTLQGALNGAPALPSGESYQITVTYTTASGKNAGDNFTETLKIYSSVVDSSDTLNNAEASQVSGVTNTVTIIKGAAAVTKIAQSCGTDATCAAPINTTTIKPGEYVLYTLSVKNTGTAALKFPTLNDYVPENTVFESVIGETTNGAVLYSNDRSNWKTLIPTSLATSSSATSGPFIYVGVNSNGDSTINSADALQPGETLTMKLIVKVRDTGTSN